MHLRRATPADAAAILAVIRDAYAGWVLIVGREPRPMQVDYVNAAERHRIDLHHVDGTLAALVEMHPVPDHLLIVKIAVAPAFQRRGLGVALLDHAEHVAAELGLDEVRLYTRPHGLEHRALPGTRLSSRPPGGSPGWRRPAYEQAAPTGDNDLITAEAMPASSGVLALVLAGVPKEPRGKFASSPC